MLRVLSVNCFFGNSCTKIKKKYLCSIEFPFYCEKTFRHDVISRLFVKKTSNLRQNKQINTHIVCIFTKKHNFVL